MKNLLGALSLGLAMLIVPTVQAQDHHDEQNQRYYDSKHKDYHSWSNDDDKKWHEYRKSNHKPDKDWKSASKREQQGYFDYSHAHEGSH